MVGGRAYEWPGRDDVGTDESAALSLKASRSSIVLLRNDKDLLPLPKGKRIAVIGPHADATQAMLSNYHGDNELVNDHSPLAAAQKRWPSATITHAVGVNDTTSDDKSGFPAAVAAAKAADVAVVFVGLTPCNGW